VTWHGVRSRPVNGCDVDDKLNVPSRVVICAMTSFDMCLNT
jgi:hypothetical protein